MFVDWLFLCLSSTDPSNDLRLHCFQILSEVRPPPSFLGTSACLSHIKYLNHHHHRYPAFLSC